MLKLLESKKVFVCHSYYIYIHLFRRKSSFFFFKPSKSELLAACAQLGVSVAGSASDIINRLEELLLYKDIYPKMFIKLQKTGGMATMFNF